MKRNKSKRINKKNNSNIKLKENIHKKILIDHKVSKNKGEEDEKRADFDDIQRDDYGEERNKDSYSYDCLPYDPRSMIDCHICRFQFSCVSSPYYYTEEGKKFRKENPNYS